MLFPYIDPTAFSIFGWSVRWYGLLYFVGISTGWWWMRRRACAFGLTRKDVDDFVPWLVLGVVLGGRLGYVLFYDLGSFLDNPQDIFKTWRGGMSFHGGLVGVLFASFFFTTRRRLSFGSFLDALALSAPIAIFCGRLGNLINQEVYGHITDVPWAVIFPVVDFYPRHPSQIYEALLEGALLFVVLNRAAPVLTGRPWRISGLFLLSYGTLRWFCELYRVPDGIVTMWDVTLTQGQLLSLPMLIAGAILLWWPLKKKT